MYQKEVFEELMYQFVSGEITTEGKAQLLKMIMILNMQTIWILYFVKIMIV